MTIREQINAVLALFGLTAKAKSGLSAEETEKVAAEYKTRYNKDLADDLAKMKDDESKAKAFNDIMEALKGVAEEKESDDEDDSKKDPESEENPEDEDSNKEDEEEQSSAEAATVNKIKKLLSDNEALKKEKLSKER